jgi:hypothetical protein
VLSNGRAAQPAGDILIHSTVNNQFYSLSNDENNQRELENTLGAIIDETQTVATGSTVKSTKGNLILFYLQNGLALAVMREMPIT